MQNRFMKRLIIIIAILICSIAGFPASGGDSVLSKGGFFDIPDRFSKSAELYRFGKVNIIKLSPALHGFKLKGATLSYETGFGVWPLPCRIGSII